MKKDYVESLSLKWGLISKYRNQIYGFSILWIVVFHIWETFNKKLVLNWAVIDIVKRGNMGVDIFLLLSGVSLYFAMKKNPDQTLNQFYRRRFSKIFRIYLTVCVPFFLFMFLTGNYSIGTFIKQVFFMSKGVSSFWFILVITICYAIYPFLFRLIDTNQKKKIYFLTIIYSLLLVLFMILNEPAYRYYEILLSRIPVFLLGSTLGNLVYEDRKIPSWVLVLSLLILVSLGPFNMIVAKIPLLNSISVIMARYMLGLQGFAVIIVFITFSQFLEDTLIFKWLGNLGTITLEVYVVHIILRILAFNVIKISVNSRKEILLFSIIYVPLSLILAKVLNILFNLSQGKGTKRVN